MMVQVEMHLKDLLKPAEHPAVVKASVEHTQSSATELC